MFAMFDLDGDSKLDRIGFRELTQFFTGSIPPCGTLNRIWSSVDCVGEGLVSLEQFSRWLTHKPAIDGHQSEGLSNNLLHSSSSAVQHFCSWRPDPPKSLSVLQAYMHMRKLKPVRPYRQPWFNRHQITGCENDGAVHPSIRGYFSRRKSELSTAEGRARIQGL